MNKKIILVLIGTLFFLGFIFNAYAEIKGRISSIDSDGYVYIDLGSKDGIEEGAFIDIYEGGKRILTLPVRAVYSDSSQLEPPKRRDLSKLEAGLMVVARIEEEAESLQGRVISFDFQEGSGFINLGTSSGIEEGAVFEVLKDGQVVANLQVSIAFNKTSKFLLIDEKPPAISLEGLDIRLKEEEMVSEGVIRRWRQWFKNKFSGQFKSIYTRYDIDGNKSQSFYTEGDNYREELDLRYRDKLHNKNIEGFFSGRWTDDKYVDTERFSMEDFYLQLKDEKFSVRLGDVLGNFTNYSLITSLKGIKSELTGLNTFGEWTVEGIGGVTKGRWEDLWSEIEDEVYTRYVSGLRLAQDCGKDLTVGFNFISTDDDKDGSASPSTIPQENRVASIDLETKLFNRLDIDTELATSFTEFNETRVDEKVKNDFAFNLDIDLDLGEWQFENGYERVGTNFRSLSAVASTDREEHDHRIEYNPSNTFSGSIGSRHFRNNLIDHSSRTTFTDVYESDCSINPLSRLPDFNIDLGYEMRKRTSSDTTIDTMTYTHSIDLNNRSGVYTYGLDYSLIRKYDDVTLSNSRHKQIWDIFLRSRYQFENIRLNPNISYSIENDKQRTTKDVNTYQTLKGGFNLYIGKYTTLNFSYTHSDTDYDIAGKDQVRNLTDVALKHYLFKDRNRLLKFSFKKNDFKKENDDNSYSEDIFQLSYTQKF